ncbi:MAG: hypothetical protein KZQ89_02940 [Candidatus Thiodiazotropha sp. (ex Lucinoma kastoroae)]|nr:hypothetical protein [Candidatus Thiodiazotropha sp. (ex Lucinoma kastoroae)]
MSFLSQVTEIVINRKREFHLPRSISIYNEFIIESSLNGLDVYSLDYWREIKLEEIQKYKDFDLVYNQELKKIEDPEAVIVLDEKRMFKFSVQHRRDASLSGRSVLVGAGENFQIYNYKNFESQKYWDAEIRGLSEDEAKVRQYEFEESEKIMLEYGSIEAYEEAVGKNLKAEE